MTGVTAVPDIMPLQDSRFARCGRDSCVADIWKHGRRLRLLATRSSVFIDRRRFEPACADADIVVSDRRLPYWCAPRRSEEHTSELQALMRISYAVFCLKKKKK